MANTITKRDLVKRIAKHSRRFTHKLTAQILTHFFDSVIWALRRKGRLELRDFGVFFVVDLPARTGRNPHTGEAVEISQSRHVRFKMSKRMKEQLNR